MFLSRSSSQVEWNVTHPLLHHLPVIHIKVTNEGVEVGNVRVTEGTLGLRRSKEESTPTTPVHLLFEIDRVEGLEKKELRDGRRGYKTSVSLSVSM